MRAGLIIAVATLALSHPAKAQIFSQDEKQAEIERQLAVYYEDVQVAFAAVSCGLVDPMYGRMIRAMMPNEIGETYIRNEMSPPQTSPLNGLTERALKVIEAKVRRTNCKVAFADPEVRYQAKREVELLTRP